MVNFFKNIFNRLFNHNEEVYRGSIKSIMKSRGLRSVSFVNYFKWRDGVCNENPIHSLKLNIEDGYVNAFLFGKNGRCGKQVQPNDEALYKSASEVLNEIISREKDIPSSIKRNILVKMSR